jgi:hypothetical protein
VMWHVKRCKCFVHMGFLKKHNTQNLQDFAETALELEFFLDDSDQHINADGDPDLCFHRILRSSEKRFDPKILFDPLEKKFHSPAAFVKLSDRKCRKGEVVGEEREMLFGVLVEVTDATNRIWIVVRGLETFEDDRLIAPESCRLVDLSVGTPGISHVALRSNNKECEALREHIKASEIDVAPVHHIESACFQDELVEDSHIVDFSLCNSDKRGNISSEVEQGMELDGSLVFAKPSPWKERKTQIDCGRVERVSSLFQSETEVVVSVKLPCNSNQNVGEISVNLPVSCFVGIGEGAPSDFSSKADMIESRLKYPETRFDIPQAFAISELSERHRKELIQAGERLNFVIAAVSVDALVEFVLREKIQNLGKDGSAGIHGSPCS